MTWCRPYLDRPERSVGGRLRSEDQLALVRREGRLEYGYVEANDRRFGSWSGLLGVAHKRGPLGRARRKREQGQEAER